MIRMMLVAGVCAAHLASAAVGAQSLYTCADSQGQNSYQSMPCNEHQQQLWARDIPTVSPSPPAPRRSTEASATKPKAPLRTAAARSARSGGGKSSRSRSSGAAISMHGDPAACAKAKERRSKAYERLGLKRNFETSRKMDDLVHEACR